MESNKSNNLVPVNEDNMSSAHSSQESLGESPKNDVGQLVAAELVEPDDSVAPDQSVAQSLLEGDHPPLGGSLEKEGRSLLRYWIAAVLLVLIVCSIAGSRHYCDCDGSGSMGWNGIQRIAFLNVGNQRKEHIYQLCNQVCSNSLPLVSLNFGSPFETSG